MASLRGRECEKLKSDYLLILSREFKRFLGIWLC